MIIVLLCNQLKQCMCRLCGQSSVFRYCHSRILFFCRYHGNSDEVGCFVAARPLSKRNHYFEVSADSFA